MNLTANVSKPLLFILALLVVFCPLGIDLYLPAFIEMQTSLEVSEQKIQHTISIYMLVVGLGQLITGPLTDKYGRKPIATIGISFYGLGALVAAFGHNWEIIMMARLLQGLGACATFVCAFAIVRDSFGHKGSGQMITYLNGIVCFIPALAPILGAWLTLQFGWRSNFIFLAGFALLGLMLFFIFYKETKPADSYYEGHILDFRRFRPMLSSKHYMFNAALTMIGMSAMLVFVISAPGWMMVNLGLDVETFTFWFTLNAIVSILASFIAPKFINKHSKASLKFGLVLFITGGIALIIAPERSILSLMLPMYVASIGFAFTLGAAAGQALSQFPKQAGTASALIGVMQMSGAGVLATLTQWLPVNAPTQLAIHLLSAIPFLILLCIPSYHYLHQEE